MTNYAEILYKQINNQVRKDGLIKSQITTFFLKSLVSCLIWIEDL